MRKHEKHGSDFYFISKEEFQKMKEENKFIETMELMGDYFGTSFDELDRVLKTNNVILDINFSGT